MLRRVAEVLNVQVRVILEPALPRSHSMVAEARARYRGR